MATKQSLEIDFPRLNGAELLARFGNDEAALRRYRMLAALLREGRPAGEVAQTFGVSRESLRRLRHAFQKSGLMALHTRKRGGGHLMRGSPLAQAITQELRLDPGVSAGVLWQRIQVRMREEGLKAPRSTFYRLLASLRDDDNEETSTGIPIRAIREALGALLEDPPLALGRSALAELLLPDENNILQRGRRLQDTLHAAISRLRPSEAGPVLDDPRWRHYLIIAGEYQTGEERATLASALALSSSTYSRAKREALERLVTLLPVVLSELPPTAPPASLIEPPPAPATFDHEGELDLYISRLRRGGLALIWGPTGVGKIDLAAMLAERLRARGQQVVWHTCRPPGADRDAGAQLLLAFATALALDGNYDLWNVLNAPTPGNFARRIELLESGLEGRHWTVIVANTHWLVGAEASRVLSILTAAQQRRDIRLVLVGRHLPGWANPEEWPPLPFASDSVARRAFIARLAGEPLQPPSNTLDLAAIQERTNDLLSTLTNRLPPNLTSEQAESILAILRPIEVTINQLRSLNSKKP